MENKPYLVIYGEKYSDGTNASKSKMKGKVFESEEKAEAWMISCAESQDYDYSFPVHWDGHIDEFDGLDQIGYEIVETHELDEIDCANRDCDNLVKLTEREGNQGAGTCECGYRTVVEIEEHVVIEEGEIHRYETSGRKKIYEVD